MGKTNKLYMMNKTIFLLIGMIMFSSVLVSAEVQTLDDNLKQFDCISLAQKYANSTYTNITTITYPNSTSYTVNYQMTGADGIWNYEFCDTSQLGEYEYCTRTDVDGIDTDVCINFVVTPGGLSGTLGFYFLILILSAGAIILGFSIRDGWVVVLGGFGLTLVGLFILFYGIDGMKDTVYTWGLGIIVLMLGAYFSIRAAIETIED